MASSTDPQRACARVSGSTGRNTYHSIVHKQQKTQNDGTYIHTKENDAVAVKFVECFLYAGQCFKHFTDFSSQILTTR
jgi:hypothetical protein